jgi:phage terminase large subunit GpA-like protein
MLPVSAAFANPLYKRVTIICASQMGKTDTIANVIGQRFEDDPCPTLYVGPTRSNVEKVIEPRLMAMFRSAASLWPKLAKGKRSSKTSKFIAGIQLRLGWAGSASELSSMEAGLAFVDELDRMNIDVGGEGSPLTLIEARLSTFPDGKLGITSTPTRGRVRVKQNETTGLSHWEAGDSEEIESPIWRLWQEGTRYEWAWGCPDCGDYFIPRFELLKWPEKATPAIAKREAKLLCPHCGVLIDDRHKAEMNSRGVYVAPGQSVDKDGNVGGDIEPNDAASFWVSGLCSPWKTFGDRARSWVQAVRSGEPQRIQAVLNTGFGELFQVGADAMPWEDVRNLAAPYHLGEVPQGVRVITAGIDVQKDRLIYAVRGWGMKMESWLIGFGEIYGETEREAVWAQLGELLDTDYSGLRIRLCAVDSGYRPGDKWRRPEHMVYRFARSRAGVIATKGHDRQDKPLRASRIDVKAGGQTVRRGLQLWHVDSDHFKSWVQGRLSWPPDQPGGWRIPEDVTNDYCQQLTAEARTVKASGRAVWVRVRRENHGLDCEALNVVCAYVLGLERMRPKAASNASASSTEPAPPKPSPVKPNHPVNHPAFRPYRKNWTTNW